jgi:hypothetical protein
VDIEDQDEILPIDDEHLKLEIHVRAGQHHAVECTAIIEVNMTDPQKAANKIRDTIQTIRMGMPIEELKVEDREHFQNVTELVMSKGGEVRVVPVGTVKAEKNLAELKKEMEEQNGDLPTRA